MTPECNTEQQMADGDRVEMGEIHRNQLEMFKQLASINEKVTAISTVCGPCQERLYSLEQTLDGNGNPGLKQRLAVVESGRTDTLSIKSVGMLLGFISALLGGIMTAVGMLLGRSAPPLGP